MVERKELYKHLSTMLNLLDVLEEVMRSKIMDKDFKRTIYFSIMGILKYSNVIKIIMNNPIL